MKIDKIMQISINTKLNNRLCKNSIIRGKIIDVSENIVFIDLGNGDIIKANTLISLEKYKNKILNFIVKDLTGDNIVLTPLNRPYISISDKTEFIKELLKNYNLNVSQENMEIVENLIKFKMPINKEVIEKIIKILKKIKELVTIKENENIKYLGNYRNIMSDSILKLLKDSTVVEKAEKNILNSEIMTIKIQNELRDILNGSEVTTEIIKEVIFLLKSKIKVSINSLKFLNELINDGSFLESDLEEFLLVLYEKNIITDKEFNKLRTVLNNLVIKFNEEDKCLLRVHYNNLKQIFEKLELILHEKEELSNEILEKLQTIKDKIVFLNKLNENATFIYYPFYFTDRSELINKFYILDKRKFKGRRENLNVMISLQTNRFDKIKILANVIKDSITVNFYMDKYSYIKIFKKSDYKLKDSLIKCGFNKVFINYISGEDINPLDIFSDSSIKNYLLDIRV